MQVIDEQDVTYYNFINSLDSEYTKKYYKFCLEKFLNRYEIDLASLLKLPEDQLTNLIIKNLAETKISKSAKEIDTYIDFRNRHGERLTDDSYLLVKRFDTRIRTEGFIGQPFKDNGIPRMLEDFIRDSDFRNIDHKNPHKRKEIPYSSLLIYSSNN